MLIKAVLTNPVTGSGWQEFTDEVRSGGLTEGVKWGVEQSSIDKPSHREWMAGVHRFSKILGVDRRSKVGC